MADRPDHEIGIVDGFALIGGGDDFGRQAVGAQQIQAQPIDRASSGE